MSLTGGFRLGSYEILSPLGAGGMGEVYRARDVRLGREVAIKVLPERLADDAEALSRFERESKAVAALSHPNILALHDVGHHDRVAYAVMELLEGETLRHALTSGPLSLRRAKDYAVQIALGLGAAHEKGIVHRDLKPDNVFVTRDERVKILDFGLAKRDAALAASPSETQSPTVSGYTEPGAVLGTVGYMSPEQVRGLEVDPRSDIFSFGSVLYEMLTGRRAFQRETPVETMTAILNDEPRDLGEAGGDVPPALAPILRHCWKRSPTNGFSRRGISRSRSRRRRRPPARGPHGARLRGRASSEGAWVSRRLSPAPRPPGTSFVRAARSRRRRTGATRRSRS
jgi:serine/threonine protein kinase